MSEEQAAANKTEVAKAPWCEMRRFVDVKGRELYMRVPPPPFPTTYCGVGVLHFSVNNQPNQYQFEFPIEAPDIDTAFAKMDEARAAYTPIAEADLKRELKQMHDEYIKLQQSNAQRIVVAGQQPAVNPAVAAAMVGRGRGTRIVTG